MVFFSIVLFVVSSFIVCMVMMYLTADGHLLGDAIQNEPDEPEIDFGKQLRDIIRSKLVSYQRESIFDSWAEYTIKDMDKE